VKLSGNKVRRLNHSDEGDRDLLRQVYRWAEATPAIYLDGGGYKNAEDFLDPPRDSFEYIVFVAGEPAALLTFIPLVTVRKVYQVGLITNPDASLLNICKLLRGFMGAVFETMSPQALFVDLPDSPEFLRTRKLARFFGFKQFSATTFLIVKSEYGNTKRPQADDNPDRDDQLPGLLSVLRPDAGRAATRGVDA
jgi:hypothetical protein